MQAIAAVLFLAIVVLALTYQQEVIEVVRPIINSFR
jgi:hypothetical protein